MNRKIGGEGAACEMVDLEGNVIDGTPYFITITYNRTSGGVTEIKETEFPYYLRYKVKNGNYWFRSKT